MIRNGLSDLSIIEWGAEVLRSVSSENDVLQSSPGERDQ